MGRAKATLPLDGGDTFLSRIVRTFLAAGVDDVVVVVGHDAEAIVNSFTESGLRARFVANLDYDRGQLSSLVAGLTVVDRPGVTAALVTLVDVPLVSAETVRAVLDRYRLTHAPIVRPTSGARHGHPLLIDRSLFDALRAADPDAGAKPIVRAHASAAGDIDIADEGAFTQTLIPRTKRCQSRTMVGLASRASAVASRASARVVVRRVGQIFHCRECVVFGVPAHLGHRIPLRDQPGADTCRDFSHRTGLQNVEPDAVELVLAWLSLDADSHLVKNAANVAPFQE